MGESERVRFLGIRKQAEKGLARKGFCNLDLGPTGKRDGQNMATSVPSEGELSAWLGMRQPKTLLLAKVDGQEVGKGGQELEPFPEKSPPK